MAQLFSHLSKHHHSPSGFSQNYTSIYKYIAQLVLFLWSLILPDSSFAAQSMPSLSIIPPAQSYNFTLDFEEGSLRGWSVKGNAFNAQPTLDDNPTARHRGQPSNHQGRYWIGTYENFQGRARQQPGAVQGDAPQGILTSAQFIVPKGQMSFLVGGGNSFETRVELLVQLTNDPEFGRKRVYWTAGKNTETMHRVYWDLNPYAGKPATIQIIDLSSGGWGHINADDFRFSSAGIGIVPPPEVQTPKGVPVPQLIGRYRDQAVEMIAGHKLKFGGIKEQVSGQKPNTVIAQNPQANQVVQVGTTVYLVIAVPDMVPVPELKGYEEVQAKNILVKNRLQVGKVVYRQSDERQGTVIAQEPRARNMVLAGSQVHITVALPRDIELPRVIDFSRNDAISILEDKGLTIGKIAERRSPKQPDTVLDQRPAPGTIVKSGSPVSLLVAVPDMVPVPDLLRHTEEQAKYMLEEARLQMGRVVKRQSDERPGAIIAQEPKAATMVVAGSHIDIAVAVIRDIEVPRVIDFSQDDAINILKSKKLTVGAITKQRSGAIPKTILDQTPAPGTIVKLGSPVSLLVAIPALVRVPDLVGKPKNQADSTLQAAQLKLGEITQQPSKKPVHTIINQQPQPESLVSKGTSVDILVSFPRLVIVPDLSGKTRETAFDLIYSKNLKLGILEDRPSDAPMATIIGQQPLPGSEVPEETQVNLVLAAERLAIVPDLVGMLRGEAQVKISDAQLAVGSINEQASNQPAGTVLEQWPLAKQSVKKNTSVSLIIAAKEKAVIPWGLYGVIVGGTLLVAGAAYTLARRPKTGKESTAPKVRPDIVVQPHYDPGQQTLQPVGSNLANCEICLEAHLDSGTQSIEHPNELIIKKG